MAPVDLKVESTTRENKERLEIRRPKSWLKTVSAFANGKGGVLLFGVADDGSLAGLADPKGDSEAISDILKTRMDPVPQTVMEIRGEGGRSYIELTVLPGDDTPYCYVGEGVPTAYTRIGNESVVAGRDELRRLAIRGFHRSYDSLPTRHNRANFAFSVLRSVCFNRTRRELAESDYQSFGLVDAGGFLTNAGALFADEPPMGFSRVFCTRWPGLDKACGLIEATDNREITGSLLALLRASEDFVSANNHVRWKKTINGRAEMPDYPFLAVEECLLNALVHRDYMMIGSEVHIDIFDDRMEVSSPGGMVDGSFIQDIDAGNIVSNRRNPVIADVFARMNFGERRGSGLRKILDSYLHAVCFRPGKEPRFYSDNWVFRVTLPNLNHRLSLEESSAMASRWASASSLADQIGEDGVPYMRGRSHSVTLDLKPRLDAYKWSKPTKENIARLYCQFGLGVPFTRSEAMRIVGLTSTPATELMRKMREARLIAPAPDGARGKYIFTL